jgi:hypothetical protein
MKNIKSNPDVISVPKNFGNGSKVNHVDYGKGKCVGMVQGQFWRIEFENGKIKDFLPSKLFANLIN